MGKGFDYKQDLEFVQLLEVPPLPSTSPSYKRVRCAFFAKGSCASDAACTFAHDMRAPPSLVDAAKEDVWRTKSVAITQDQARPDRGGGAYGGGQNRLVGQPNVPN